MLSSRWSHLARHGLLGTTLLTIASSSARAEQCDSKEDSVFGVVLGMDITPKPRLMGGLEYRRCVAGNAEVFARLELGGGTRLIFGGRVRPFEEMAEEGNDREKIGLEAGFAGETGGKFGAHLAATYGYHFAYLAAQGLFPLGGAERPARASMLFGLSPFIAGEGTVAEGRPLILDGQLVRPAIASLPWARTAEDRAVRDHFTSSAQFEMSSVWTFLRLAAELAAVGAPDDLIAMALDAADDEVRHAGMCARAAGGVELTPLPMTCAQPRFVARSPRALEMLASEAWLEGCLNEGAAAEEARLASQDSEGTISRMLAAIARDEHRHAELSWAVLAWLFEVAPAIASRAIAVTPTPGPIVEGSMDLALVKRGVPSSQMTAAARSHAESSARTRLRDLA